MNPTEKLMPKTSSLWQTIRANVELRHRACAIQPVSRDRPIPLSFAQERLWLLHQLNPTNIAHHLPSIQHLQGQLNISALEKSFCQLIQRHEILRTTFPCVEGKVVQNIAIDVNFQLPVADLRTFTESERETQLKQLIDHSIKHPFILTQEPAWRVKLVHLTDGEFVLIRVMHHIISDAWSGNLFLQELSALYEAFTTEKKAKLPTLPIQYADFAIWQRQELQGERWSSLLNYWKQQLGDEVTALQIPIDFPHSSPVTHQGKSQTFQLSKQLTSDLKAWSWQEGVSLFVPLLAAFKVLLFAYSRQTNLLVCVPVAHRHYRDTQNLIGYFNNILVLRTNLSETLSFRDYLHRVSQVTVEAQEHQDLPFQTLSEFPNLARTPLTRAMFGLQNTPSRPFKLAEIAIKSPQRNQETADFDLFLSMKETSGRLQGKIQYKTDLFEAKTIEQMVENFQIILANLIANPQQPIEELCDRCQLQKLPPSSSQLDQSRTYPIPAWLESPLERWLFGPKNWTQEMLAQLWGEALNLRSFEKGHTPLNIFANFFELGGHSLGALRLIHRITEIFGVSLSLQDLFENPTIAGIANCIETHQTHPPFPHLEQSESPRFLVPLKTGGTKTPLFWVTGGDGTENTLMFYAKLIFLLGQNQPVYGLCTRTTQGKGWLSHEAEIHTSLDTLAQEYCHAIQSVQPQGPYLIAGECIGGVLAFEVAQQLRTQGHLTTLILLDTRSPENSPKPQSSPSPEAIADAIAQARHQSNPSLLSPIAYAHYQTLIATYQPKPYMGKISLIVSQETVQQDPTLGWETWATAGVEVHYVPGNHESYLGKFVRETATQLQRCLAIAEEGVTEPSIPLSEIAKAADSTPDNPHPVPSGWNEISQDDRLIILCENALKIHPHRIDIYLQLGQTWHYRKHQLDSAIRCYQAILTLDPCHAKAYRLLGNALRQQGQLESALTAYQTSINLNPQDGNTYFEMGNTQRQLGQMESALENCQRAIAIEPNHFWAHHVLGDVLIQTAQLDAGIACQIKAITLNPHRAEPYMTLGQAYTQQQKLDAAIASYQQAIAVNPQHFWAYRLLADLYKQTEQWDLAISYYQKAIHLDPSHFWAHRFLGDIYQQQGNLEEAISSYQQAIAIDPNNFWVYGFLGDTYRKQGNLQQAIVAYQKASEVQPENPLIYGFLGNILCEVGDRKGAIYNYQKAIALNPKQPFGVYKKLGDLLFQNAQIEAAIVAYKEACKLQPQNKSIRQTLEKLESRKIML